MEKRRHEFTDGALPSDSPLCLPVPDDVFRAGINPPVFLFSWIRCFLERIVQNYGYRFRKSRKKQQKNNGTCGTLLLRKLIEDLNLQKTINTVIHDRRPRSYRPSDIILPTVLMLHTGGGHLENIGRMAKDTALCQLHHLGHIPHSTTISRWCNYHGTDGLRETASPDIPENETIRALDSLIIHWQRKASGKANTGTSPWISIGPGLKAKKRKATGAIKAEKVCQASRLLFQKPVSVRDTAFKGGMYRP